MVKKIETWTLKILKFFQLKTEYQQGISRMLALLMFGDMHLLSIAQSTRVMFSLENLEKLIRFCFSLLDTQHFIFLPN